MANFLGHSLLQTLKSQCTSKGYGTMWMATSMHCQRVGMWLAIDSPEIDLVICTPWGTMKTPIDFLGVWVDILCIVCKWGFLKVLMRVHWNPSDQECESKCTSHGYGGCEVVVGYPYIIHSLKMWMDMDCMMVVMGFTIRSLMATMRLLQGRNEVPSTCTG